MGCYETIIVRCLVQSVVDVSILFFPVFCLNVEIKNAYK